MTEKIHIEIPARGGSKGVPRKALRLLGGKPLIAYTIEHALSVDPSARVFVNTDDAEIRDVSVAFGAEVPFLRPAELATDSADLGMAHRYALDWYNEHQGFVPDVVIIMSPTNPFRRKNLVRSALETALFDERVFNISSVAPAAVDPEHYFVRDGSKWAHFSGETSLTEKPKVFYQCSMSFNLVMNGRAGSAQPGPIPFPLNDIEAIDIDTEKDFYLASLVIEKELYPFE